MNITVIAICTCCIITAIVLDTKWNIPIGLTCTLASFLICHFAFEESAGNVVSAFFPSTIVFPLILAMAFFSTFTSNGCSQVVAGRITRILHGKIRLYPWVLYLLCTGMYIFFDGGALRFVITPLIFSVAKAGGSSSLMAVSTAYMSFVTGSLNPYVGIDASTRAGILSDLGLQNASNVNLAVWVNAIILFTLLQGIIYVGTGSWKIPDMEYDENNELESLTADQKKSFVLLGVTVLLFVGPPLVATAVPCAATQSIASLFNNYNVFICGMIAVIVLGLGNWRDMLNHVSLRPIMMIIGITFLIKTAQKAGLQELCLSAANLLPGWMLPPALLLIGATLSFFVAAPTIQPMLFAMACAMAETPAQAILYLTCVTVGTVASGVSPLSNSGVAFLSTVDVSEHDKYAGQMFKLAIVGPIIMALICCTGILEPVSACFSAVYY